MGLECERQYEAAVAYFTNLPSVTDNDVKAASLLQQAGQFDLLALLHRRTITAACVVDEDSAIGDLRSR